MTGFRGVPPGRAGRLWLRGRLATAERGVQLLRAKVQVLQREQERYRAEARRSAAAWEAACRDAEGWLVRAALLGGRRALADAVPEQPATAEVSWTVAMGVRHPREAVVRAGQPSITAAVPGTAALPVAADRYRTALEAAGRHAVAAEAVRRLDTEVAATRRRLRAVEDRWVPRLTAALHEVEVGLEELELSEGGRLRWAAGNRQWTGGEP